MKKTYLILFTVVICLCSTELSYASSPRSLSDAGAYSQPYDHRTYLSQVNPPQDADTIFLENRPGYMVVGGRLMKIPRQPRHIDWRPARQDARRYTIAVSPLYVVNNGIRIDYECELPSSISWVQYHLMVCGRGWYGGRSNAPYYVNREGWSSAISAHELYSKLFGIGAGVAYKRMISSHGWYYSFGGESRFYDVRFYANVYSRGYDETVLMNNKYYKFATNFNFGKHFALTDHLFLDFYAGLGLMGYVADNDSRYGELNYQKFWGMSAFEYSGLYVNGGIRVGWLWNRPK